MNRCIFHDDEEGSCHFSYKRFVGKTVRAVIDSLGETPPLEGRLIYVFCDGEFAIDIDGVTHYCWPALEMEEVCLS